MKFGNLCVLIVLLFVLLLSVPASAGSVSLLTVEQEKKVLPEEAENPLVNCYYKSALVRIPENPEAETKINEQLKALEKESAEEWEKSGDEQIQFWYDSLENGAEWQSWIVTEIRTELTPERVDDAVISFQVMDYTYTGGAHGMYAITGLTFDAGTGDQLAFADLSDSPDELREVCITEIIQQCQLMENLWWNDEPSLRAAAETIVDRNSWYLTEDGIVFHAIPYEIAPYASGAVEFPVSYDLLPGMKYLLQTQQ